MQVFYEPVLKSCKINAMGAEKLHTGQMIEIPAGPFLMGSDEGLDIELPVHEVTLDAFLMDVYPVTNAQFKAFIKDCPQWQKETEIRRSLNPYYLYFWRKGLIYPKGKRDHPAVYMNWFAAAAYCNWRSRLEGLEECYDETDGYICNFDANGYRLPTEAEFEKAARGGLEQALYPWGNEIDKSKANYDNLIGDTTEVGTYPPNGYGLYDMGGNIAHWCQDWFDPDYYGVSPSVNPRGPEMGTHRVYRGGAWGNPEELQRCSYRFFMRDLNVNPDFGFRCVRR